MAIYESIHLSEDFPFRFLINQGYRLTTPHFHGEYEIIYVETGSINLGVEKDLFQLEEGQLFIIRPHVEHYIVPEKDSVRYVFQFQQSLFGNHLMQEQAAVIEMVNPNSCFWHNEVCHEIIERLHGMKQEFDQKHNGYEFQIMSDLLRIYVILMRNEYDHNKTIYHETKKIQKLKKVFQYVEDNYKYKIYVDEVADLLGYNAEYFSRFFKKNTGLNFTDFLLDYRLTKAKWDLLTTKDSIHQIIFNNGFSNTATFYRNFKEYSGLSPKEYRDKHHSQ